MFTKLHLLFCFIFSSASAVCLHSFFCFIFSTAVCLHLLFCYIFSSAVCLHFTSYLYNFRCTKEFSDIEELRKHFREDHRGLRGNRKQTCFKKISCEECGNRFYNKLQLENHINRIHLNEKKYPCTRYVMCTVPGHKSLSTALF